MITTLVSISSAVADPHDRTEPTLVYREYWTSILPHPDPKGDSLTTYRLERRTHGVDEDATLTIELATSDTPGSEPTVGAHTSSTTFTGSVEPSTHASTMFRLHLSSGGTKLVLACAPATIEVADAGSSLIQDPKFTSECNGHVAWSPKRTTKVRVLECMDGTHDLVFAPGAGLEQVSVNDECALSGRGVRRIPAAGRLAAARGKVSVR